MNSNQAPNVSRPRRLASLAVCVALAAAAATAAAAPLSVRRYSTDDGLPAHTINAIAQTSDGYLWLATAGGLARFDGQRFTVFSTQSGLPNNRIEALAVDRDGALWLSPEEGYVMRRDGPRFTHVARAKSCRQLVFDHSAKLWCGYERALQRLDGDSWLDAPVTLSANPQLTVDENGVAWGVLSDLHPARLDDGRIEALPFQGDVTTRLVRSLSDGLILFSRVVAGRTEVVDADGRARFSIPRGDDSRAWLIDRDGALWTTTGEVLELWLPAREQPLLQLMLTEAGTVTGAFEDRERNVWIGSTTGGLYRVQRTSFRWFGAAQGMPLERVWYLRELWHGPLVVSQGKASAYRLDGDRFVVDPDPQLEANTVSYDVGPDGTEWRGTATGEVLVQRTGSTQRWVLSPTGTEPTIGVAASRLQPGVVWAITPSALFRVEPGAPSGNDVQRVIDGLAVTHSVLEDTQGAVWVSTQAGLHRWLGSEHTAFTAKDGVPIEPLLQIHKDRSGTLWIGSYGGGLVRSKNGRFAVIGSRDGLSEDVVSAVLEDDAGNLWMAGNRGIQRVSLAELNARAEGTIARVHAVAYGRDAGLINPEGSGYPGLKTGDGRLWFPMLTGLAAIDPKLATSVDARAPQVEIERVDCTPDRRLMVEYAGLSLSAGEQLRYRYQLEGFDTEWIDAGPSRQAIYTNLPPGDYTFCVQAAVGGSDYTLEAASQSISIAPRFTETRLFYALCGIAVLSLTFVAVRWRTGALRSRTVELERVIEAVDPPRAPLQGSDSLDFANQPADATPAGDAPRFAEQTQKLPVIRDAEVEVAAGNEDLPLATQEAVEASSVATGSEAAIIDPAAADSMAREPIAAEPVASEPVAADSTASDSIAADEPVVLVPIRTVLLVDDNAQLRAFLRTHLEPRFDVVEASDGEDGLRAAQQHRPDLILTDAAMPMMDGFALCRALRHDPSLKQVPVILFAERPSAASPAPQSSDEIDVAADLYLPKPFQPSELLDGIDALSRTRRRPAPGVT
ncbi:MAG: two-component regulator propeller domain-containing protein [Acidobacteriota bacterium]